MTSKPKIKAILSMSLAVMMLIMSLVSFSFVKKVDAGFIGLGRGIGFGPFPISWSNVLYPSLGNRTYTVEELFSDTLYMTYYYGEDEATWILKENFFGVSELVDGEVKERIKSVRSFSSVIGGWFSFIPNAIFTFSSSIVKYIQFFVSTLFADNFICRDPKNPSDGCINLIGIIGGTGESDKGIVGALGDSIFIPLVVLVFLLVALWLLYQGLIKRQIRSAMGGLAWALMTFIIGVVFVARPYIFVRGPQSVNNVVSYCILSAINGESCLSDSSVDLPSPFVSSGCHSTSSSATIGQKIGLTINSLNCGIWKTFIMDGVIEGQWGVSSSKLFTTRDSAKDNFGEVFTKDLYGGGEAYGVMLYSSKSPNQMISEGATFDSGGKVIYHLGIAQLAASTQGGMQLYGTKDELLNKIIVTAATDPDTWRTWAPAGGTGDRWGMAFRSLIATIAAAIPLIILAVTGHVYSFSATLLLAFAPLFFLIGIHPGKGRRIFMGWVESVISMILKYMAVCFMIIIILMMFAAVLQGTSGFISLVAVIILSVGFMNYRKEFVNMLGTVSMGGERMTNVAANKWNSFQERWRQKRARKHNLAAVAATGLAAAALSGKSVGLGMKEAVKQELRQRGGAAGRAVQTVDRIREEERTMQRHMRDSRAEAAARQAVDVAERHRQMTANPFDVRAAHEFRGVYGATGAAGEAMKKEYLEQRSVAQQEAEQRVNEILNRLDQEVRALSYDQDGNWQPKDPNVVTQLEQAAHIAAENEIRQFEGLAFAQRAEMTKMFGVDQDIQDASDYNSPASIRARFDQRLLLEKKLTTAEGDYEDGLRRTSAEMYAKLAQGQSLEDVRKSVLASIDAETERYRKEALGLTTSINNITGRAGNADHEKVNEEANARRQIAYGEFVKIEEVADNQRGEMKAKFEAFASDFRDLMREYSDRLKEVGVSEFSDAKEREEGEYKDAFEAILLGLSNRAADIRQTAARQEQSRSGEFGIKFDIYDSADAFSPANVEASKKEAITSVKQINFAIGQYEASLQSAFKDALTLVQKGSSKERVIKDFERTSQELLDTMNSKSNASLKRLEEIFGDDVPLDMEEIKRHATARLDSFREDLLKMRGKRP